LLDKGADVNFNDLDMTPPLHTAVIRELNTNLDDSIIGLLIQRGADVNIQNQFGDTALHHIARRPCTGHSSHLTKLLLDNGANVQTRNHAGQTALNVAADRKNRTIHKMLIDAWLRHRNIEQRPPQRD
jgi:ankyrin repeat protein